MKSESQLMNDLSHRSHFLRELTDEESAKLKSVIISIFKDVVALCDKYGLTYMLSGGSCLGAIRHHGFIPWDDDLDIMLPRKDYNALINILEKGELGEKYEFSFPNPKTDANIIFLKIFRKHTKDVELFNINTPFPKGVYIDVFAIDAVPKYKWVQKVKGFIANAIQYTAIARLYKQYPSIQLREYMYMDKALKKRYKLKMFLGTFASFASHAKWIYWFDKFVSSDRDDRQWGIPTGRKYYNGEIFDKDVFVPVKKAVFEGLEVNVPNDTHTYLTNLYNNYMQLPPEDKRERHFVCMLELPNN